MQPNKYQKNLSPHPPHTEETSNLGRPRPVSPPARLQSGKGSMPFSKERSCVPMAAFALVGITQSSATSPGGITLPINGKNPPCRLGENYGQAAN